MCENENQNKVSRYRYNALFNLIILIGLMVNINFMHALKPLESTSSIDIIVIVILFIVVIYNSSKAANLVSENKKEK